MKRGLLIIFSFVFAMALVSAYPITGEAIETDSETITAGTTPDSIWYGLDVAIDNINVALASKDKKTEKSLNVARERLLEIKQMINEDKIEESLRAQEEHQEMLLKIEESIGDFDNENSTEEIEREVQLELEIEEHKVEIEETRAELKLKIKIEGELDEATQNLIDSIIAGLENSTANVEIEIKRKQGETKIKIKDQTGKTEIEIEQEFDDAEDEHGLSEFKEERAVEKLEKANDKWADLEEKAEKHNATLPSKEPFNEFIALGDQALLDGLYEEAKDYYEDAKDYAEDLKDEMEDGEDEDDEDEEIEIEIEVEGEYSKIKVKAFGEETKFTSYKITKDEIIEEISDRTGLSIEEIMSNLEFEVEDDEDEAEDDDDEEDEEGEEDEEESAEEERDRKGSGLAESDKLE